MKEIIKEMREKILEYYEMDINEAKAFHSTGNHAFVFPDESIIRVGREARKSRKQVLSEILWVDDVKQFSDTICEPYPSLQNNHFEQFEINGEVFNVAKFKKARGGMLTPDRMDNWTAMMVGNLLGRIHKASKQAEEAGIRYKRPNWNELFPPPDMVADMLDPVVLEKIRGIRDKIENMPKNTDNFGMVHGDFGYNNYYVEGNNVWVFDFDECNYCFYMYDIASTLISWLYTPGFHSGVPRREVLFNTGLLENFRKGYEYNMILPQDQWDNIELFIEFRFAYMIAGIAMLVKMGQAQDLEGGAVTDMAGLLQVFQMVLQAPDIFIGIENLIPIMAQVSNTAAIDSGEAFVNKGSDKLKIFDMHGGYRISGVIDSIASPLLEKKIDELLAKKVTDIVLDMEGVTYLSSAGIRVLLKTYKALGGKFKLLNVGENVREVLDTTGMSELF